MPARICSLINQIWRSKFLQNEKRATPARCQKGDLDSNCRDVALLFITGKICNRVLLNSLENAIDIRFRDKKAGFRNDRFCTVQTSTLSIILVQSLECDSPLYVNVVEADETLRCVAEHHKNHPEFLLGDDLQDDPWPAIHRYLSQNTGVWQGCLLSPFLFLLAEEPRREMTSNERSGHRRMTMTL